MPKVWVDHQQMPRSARKLYYRELADAISACLRASAEPKDEQYEGPDPETYPFRMHIWKWFKKGAPIDPQYAGMPAGGLKAVIRQIALSIGSLRAYHADCKLWLDCAEVRPRSLAERAKYLNDVKKLKSAPKGYSHAWIPGNYTLYAPKGTPYHELNKKGFEVREGEEPKLPKEGE